MEKIVRATSQLQEINFVDRNIFYEITGQKIRHDDHFDDCDDEEFKTEDKKALFSSDSV